MPISESSTSGTTTGQDASKSEHQSQRQRQPQTQQQDPKFTANGMSSSSSSIEIDTRSDISLLYRAVRMLIRPLRPNLVRPGKPLPTGSARLSAPKNRNGVDIVESCFEGVWQYTFCPKSTRASVSASSSSASTPASASTPTTLSETSTSDPPSSSASSPSTSAKVNGNHTSSNDGHPKHRIYYFNGGGFQSPPSSQHWLFLSTLSKNLSQWHSSSSFLSSSHAHQPQPQLQPQGSLVPEITLISYPLAPNSPAEKSFPILQKWLSAVLRSADMSHDRVTLMGDSSGGNIALSLGFWAAENYNPKPSTTSTPSFPLTSLLAISPAVDLRNVNPAMHGGNKFDPVLTIPLTSRVARAWASLPTDSKHLSEVADGPHPALLTDARLSPLLNSDAAFSALVKNRGARVWRGRHARRAGARCATLHAEV